jgi:hypothetical protein
MGRGRQNFLGNKTYSTPQYPDPTAVPIVKQHGESHSGIGHNLSWKMMRQSSRGNKNPQIPQQIGQAALGTWAHSSPRRRNSSSLHTPSFRRKNIKGPASGDSSGT